MTGATAVKVNPDGSVNLRLGAQAVSVIEDGKDTMALKLLADRIRDQLFLAECTQLCKGDEVA